jgi:glyoxylase-like metal-dependent hydrolase (beta-lactamase superfamily II)
VIDPLLNYDLESGEVSTLLADQILEFVRANGYIVEWLLETHVHGDRLSAARYLKQHFICAQLGVSERVTEIQQRFACGFELDMDTDGRQFDRLFKHNDRICLGHSCGRVLHTPGHSATGVAYIFDQFAFVGDTLCMPDCGTARCDLPDSDARALYHSLQKILRLPDETRLLMCHDNAPEGREHHYVSTVAQQKLSNVHLQAAVSETAFEALRETCDARLEAPRMLLPALRANIGGGVLPGWHLEPGLELRHVAGAAV